ncbi:hypothetical protein [Aureimonas phyllosphaerae]|uniref:Spore coat protein U (SCPU) domain-containing protein n=1 Tax=Aureimonas phyllosphaerae TaxID=1166078 RepID=A0A7W6FWK8_9HYPH|nr:hypothetical protein [Aureimonas phyllosphaerae]MBB3938328.1 hypothetical protein [Aureimonas phyllosphaerae]MBB3962340.1 hypothetical protein [Aureimonas phyllosphaerae]SFF60112.1 hypothetical protein SAMN05216566_1461 [Aureimonas phyllosphaerae]
MVRLKHALFVIVGLGSVLPQDADAGTATVTFTGTVATSCSVNVVNGTGTLTTNGALNNLSSKNPGGSPAKVDITTTGGVRVSLDAVSSATTPASDTTTTAWNPTYSMSGAQTVTETGVSTLMTGAGTRNVDINLTGTKSGGDSFIDGNYAATVTVRCE